MMQAIIPQVDQQHIEIIPVFRSKFSSTKGIVWSPGHAVDNFPRVQAIVALWGVARGDARMLANNAELGLQACSLAQTVGAQRVLHCSSAAVYSPGPALLTESAETNPPSLYGQSKLDMEHAIRGWEAETKDPPSSVFMRIGSVAGAESLFANMKPGGEITLDRFADQHGPIRSYLAPHDLVRICLNLIDRPDITGPLNVAAPNPIRMQDLANAGQCQINWCPAPETAVQAVTLDTTRLQSFHTFDAEASQADYLVNSAKQTGVWP